MGYQDRRRIFKWVSPIAIIACLLISTVAISADPGAKAVPGEFLGSDLLTEDAAAAAKFYGEIFGWDVEKADDSGYAIHHKGRLIASISQIDSADPEAAWGPRSARRSPRSKVMVASQRLATPKGPH
jgi:hypothetical protein